MTQLEAIRAGLVIVRDALSATVEDVLRREYGDKWWKTAVLLPLERDGKLPYGWPEEGNAGDLDLQTALKLVGVYHWELFSDTFDWKGRERSLLQVMIAIRNQYEGHVTPNRERELTPQVTDEILEGMARFLRLFDKKAARRLDTIESDRKEKMQAPPAPAAQPAAPKTAPMRENPVREIQPLSPAADPDEVWYRDTPLTDEERAILENSGYQSLFDQEEEDDKPITFYSRRPAPPPPPPPKPKTVLYRGVRVEEAREPAAEPRYSALNLADLRRREERRAASAAPAAEASAQKAPPKAVRKPKETPPAPEPEAATEDFPDLTPIARAEKRRVPERARRTGSAKKTRWEQDMEPADKETRSAVMSRIREDETPPERPKRPALLSARQKLIVTILSLLGVIAGIAFVILDLYLKKLWMG